MYIGQAKGSPSVTQGSPAGLTICHRRRRKIRTEDSGLRGANPILGLSGRERRKGKQRGGRRGERQQRRDGLTCEHVGDAPVERLLRRLPFAHGGLHPRTAESSQPGTVPSPSFREGLGPEEDAGPTQSGETRATG